MILRMTTTLFMLAIFVLGMNQDVWSQKLNTPMPSPKSTLTQVVGVTDVTITYHRPGVKGREIFGGLVPYGKLWRTGANSSTTIKVSDTVMFEGKKVAAGEYALFTIPEKNDWTIVLSKSVGWGTGNYKEEEDVARFKVKSHALAEKVERLTIEIADMTDNSAQIVLKWDNTAASFKMTCDTDSKVMHQIEEVMKNPPADDAGVYSQAATYYFEHGKDLKKALSWADKAVELNPDAFWAIRLKSRIQAQMGDYKKAIETAKLSLEKAKKADNAQYVKFNEEAIAEWSKK